MKLTTCAKFLAIAAAIALGGVASDASAGIFFNETFSYPDGDLTTVSGGLWTAHSGAASNPVKVVSGQAVLVQGSGTREDVNRITGATLGAGQTIYAGFDLTVPSGATDVYFAHFMSSATVFNGRVYSTNPNLGGNYTVGVSGTSTLGPEWASDLTYATTYRLVVGYDFDSGDSTLWVNPANIGSTSISFNGTFSDAVNAFGLRQAGGSFIQNIDNLIVASTFNEANTGVPEPTTLVLFGLAGIASVGVARRRS